MKELSYLISVIIPVYNTEKYLRKCVESILSQTFTDFELLLINDGSTDSSGAICDEYAQKDTRVRVFHKENGGVSSARNLGLDKARGQWITFVDSDDYVEPEMLSCIHQYEDEELIAMSYIYEKEPVIEYEKLKDKKILLSSRNLTEILMLGAFMTPYSKFYKREIIEIHKIRFNERLTAREDTLFVWVYLLRIENIRTIDLSLYHYCIKEEGLSHKRISIEESIYALDIFRKILIEYERKFVGYDKSIRYLWLTYEIFEKAIREEICENYNYTDRKQKLEKICQSDSIIDLLKDEKIIPKGIKRKIWDYLAINKKMILLTFLLYIYIYD